MKRHGWIAAAIVAGLSAPGYAAAYPVVAQPGPVAGGPIITNPPIFIQLLQGHVVQQVTTVNGLKVDKFSWLDSKRRTRTVSLKREGEGNPGHGGYAVQMTYDYKVGDVWKTAVVNPQTTAETPYEGFGYFVAHERFRKFADGDSATIARKVFNKDDSPLGLGFPVTAVNLGSAYVGRKAVQYRLSYPKYGMLQARGLDANGEDTPPLTLIKTDYKLYQLPVRITWYFESGRDYPRIRNQVSLENVPGANRVSFDMRGPYGAMNFDAAGAVVNRVAWGDRFSFSSTSSPLTRNSQWYWNSNNEANSRYNTLSTAGFEMGLVEPRSYATTQLRDGYSDARGLVPPYYNGGKGCPYQAQRMPCDYEWPYQSAQYSLPYDNANASTTGKKFAWGSTPFYGMSLPAVYDSPNTSQPFTGFPASKQLSYDVCVVLGPTGFYSLASQVAKAKGNYNCATTQLFKLIVVPFSIKSQ